MNEKNYFLVPTSTKQKQYEALRAYFVDELSAKEVANKFGYTFRAFTSLVADFRKQRKEKIKKEIFFQVKKLGRKEMQQKPSIVSKVVELRKTYISVPDIKVILDGQNIKISEKEIYLIVKQEGFARLPRRSKKRETDNNHPKDNTGNSNFRYEYNVLKFRNLSGAGCYKIWFILHISNPFLRVAEVKDRSENGPHGIARRSVTGMVTN